MNLRRYACLTGNQLKIIAALLMLVDHMGVMLYPKIETFRIIGRLSFPIYAFFIAEGCVYTKHKGKYFLSVFLLGILCQGIFSLMDCGNNWGILITFSCSIVLCCLLEFVKKTLFSKDKGVPIKIFFGIAFCLAIYVTYLFTQHFQVDYGFWGCVLPLFACIARSVTIGKRVYFKILDNNIVHVILFGFGLYLLSMDFGGIQRYSWLAIPLLLLYSGQRGRWRMKWFFYLFYPAHFVVLALLQQIFLR